MKLASRSLAAIFAIAGCGGDDIEADAGGDAAVDATAPRVAPPEPPAEPALPEVSCPPGWAVASTPGGLRYCDPFPNGRRDCEGATMQAPGDAECVPVGPACPSGEWPEGLPSDRPIVFVRPGGSGSGSRAAPYGTIAEAIAAAPAGAILALSKGEHVAPGVLAGSIDMRGACTAETTVRLGDRFVALELRDRGDVAFRGLAFASTDSDFAGTCIDARATSSITLEGVAIFECGTGVTAGPSLAARDVLVRGIRAVAGFVVPRGRAELEHVVVEGRAGAGLHVDDGANVVVSRFAASAVPGVRSIASGIDVSASSVATLSEIAVIESGFGVFVTGASQVSVTDAYLEMQRGTGIAEDRAPLSIGFDSGMTATRVYAAKGALLANRSRVTLRDAVMVGAGVEGETLRGGLLFSEGCTGELERVALESTEGLYVSTRSRIVARDLHVDRTFGALASTAISIAAVDEASIELERALVSSSPASGLIAGAGATIVARDLHIVDVAASDRLAIGIGAIEATVELTRARVDRASTAGMAVITPSAVIRGTDVHIADTLPFSRTGIGRGIDAEEGGTVTLERVLVEQSRGHAVYARADSNVSLTDVALTDVAPQECVAPPCVATFGVGVGAYERAHASFVGFEIERAALCGAHVLADGEIDLALGTIEDSAIGVCLGVESYDLARLIDGVTFLGNERNLDSPSLPIPDPLPPIDVE